MTAKQLSLPLLTARPLRKTRSADCVKSVKRRVPPSDGATRRRCDANADLTGHTHLTTADSLISVHELDSRWTNGIQIRLLWCQSDGQLSVAVADMRSGECFRIDVRDGERPLDVFHHPFAYASHRRTDGHWPGKLDLRGGRGDATQHARIPA